jgi:hypothetical protein
VRRREEGEEDGEEGSRKAGLDEEGEEGASREGGGQQGTFFILILSTG